jgi:hypothetical protein
MDGGGIERRRGQYNRRCRLIGGRTAEPGETAYPLTVFTVVEIYRACDSALFRWLGEPVCLNCKKKTTNKKTAELQLHIQMFVIELACSILARSRFSNFGDAPAE